FAIAQDVLVLSDAPPGPRELRFAITVTVCDARLCLPPRTFEFQAKIEVTDAPAVELTAALKQRLDAKPEIKIVPVPARFKPEASSPPAGKADAKPAVKADTSL